MSRFYNFIEKIRGKLQLPHSSAANKGSEMQQSEKLIVFVFAFSIAAGLWLLINLGRDFVVTVQIPLSYGEFPENMAPVQQLPDYTTATFTGEGWKLLNLYGNLPAVMVDLDLSNTNLYDTIQLQMASAQDISLARVEPAAVTVEMEEALSRRVPVKSNIDLQIRRQFGLIGEPRLIPDSVTVSGARSLVENIKSWPTRTVTLENLNQSFSTEIQLEQSNELVRLSHSSVLLDAQIAEFTEGELRIPVELEGTPRHGRVALSPSIITVRYNVPVSQYRQSRERLLIRAVVNYTDIESDNTGFIEPVVIVESNELNVSIRSVSPRRLSYFLVID
ncbi:MAG: hypothetical protein LAT67_03180 [Balneolales bacterium]|nr:hypothetical protein [Balneolales bacterium]